MSGDAFTGLVPGWQAAFEEAWSSWRAGSAGVGAAVTDPAGNVVARGRNAVFDRAPGSSVLAGTFMAHAEMTALVALPVGEYGSHAIYTTFEPCAMCACTIRMYHLGRVHYATSDPVWEGMHDVFTRIPSLARHLPARELLGGPFGTFGHVLHLTALIERAPEWVIDAHDLHAPATLALARSLVGAGRLHEMATAGMAVDSVAGTLWTELSAASPEQE